MRNSLLGAVTCLLGACQLSPGAELPESVPVRAQILSDAGTAAPGTLSIEGGIAGEPFDGMSTVASLHLGVSARTEVFLDTTPYLDLDRGGDGQGDTVLGVLHRLWDQAGGRPAFALQFAGKLPTADENSGLGSGEVDFAIAGVGSRSWTNNTVWWGYQLGILGEANGPGSDLEHTLSMGGARRIQRGVGGFLDTAWTHSHEQNRQAGTLVLGAVVATSATWNIDVGMAFGFGADGGDEIVFIGFTNDPAARWAWPR